MPFEKGYKIRGDSILKFCYMALEDKSFALKTSSRILPKVQFDVNNDLLFCR
jgi:hypothetical protein